MLEPREQRFQGLPGSLSGGRSQAGERDEEATAPTHCAFDLDLPPVLLGNALGNSQVGAAHFLFGRRVSKLSCWSSQTDDYTSSHESKGTKE